MTFVKYLYSPKQALVGHRSWRMFAGRRTSVFEAPRSFDKQAADVDSSIRDFLYLETVRRRLEITQGLLSV